MLNHWESYSNVSYYGQLLFNLQLEWINWRKCFLRILDLLMRTVTWLFNNQLVLVHLLAHAVEFVHELCQFFLERGLKKKLTINLNN